MLHMHVSVVQRGRDLIAIGSAQTTIMDGMEHLDKSLLVHPVWQDKSTYLNIQESTTQNSFKTSTFYTLLYVAITG